jgi:hypothetical protein
MKTGKGGLFQINNIKASTESRRIHDPGGAGIEEE